MAVNFPPYYTSQILNADGKPVAGGLIRAYLTGTETPAPLFAPDGTPLGSSVSIDAAGNAVFCLRVGTTYRLRCIDADGAVVWTRDGVRALGETAGIENPMTGAGDMIVGAAGGEPARLAPGAEGDALKIVSGVPTWSTDEEGMQNPMTTKGDLIVGGTGGEPARLGVGTDGDILATASGAPTWEGGPKKHRNVYQNIPSPQIDDGYLGCLFYLSGSAQALTLPATANIPSKAFIDFVFLDGTATLTITPQGTTTLNEQAAAVTIGGQTATLYRLTFLGHGGSGDEWALGGSGNGDHKVSADGTDTAGYLEDKLDAGSGISLATSAGKVVVSATTQPGDHKTAVDGADASPDYLAAKLAAGTGISLTNTGSAVEIAATAQTGDHQLLVSATDAAAGYLGAKLTAGANVTLTPQTDGDGVQTLEISATGGGGGGGEYSWAVSPVQSQYNPDCNGYCYGYFVGGAQLPSVVKSFTVFARSNPYAKLNFTCWVAIYDWTDTANNRPLKSSFTWSASKHPSTDWSNFSATFNYDAPVTIDRSHMYEIVFHYHSDSGAFEWFATNYFTNVCTIWGRLSWTETGSYGATPKASFNDYSSWSSQHQAPYIQLNSWSV